MEQPGRSPVQRPGPAEQHWSMLLFESFSAGVIALGFGFAAVLVVVGLYVILVWPLTFWDLANYGLEKYAWWAKAALWSVFAAGSLVGYWCFSGAAFKDRSRGSRRPALRGARRRR
jgi:hypothetical protein